MWTRFFKYTKRITESEYDRYYQSFRERQSELDTQLALLQEAEDTYYLSAKYLLELAQKAHQLFEVAEIDERRQLIKLVLSNLRLEGRKLRYEAIKPFKTILDFSDCQQWLRFPSIKLYQMFPSDLLEQMRIKLAILKDLLNSESQYETVNVKNGQFCQYNI